MTSILWIPSLTINDDVVVVKDGVAWFGMAASLSFYLSSAMQFFGDNLSFYNGMVSMPSGLGQPGSTKRCALYGGAITLLHYWAYKWRHTEVSIS